MPDLIASPEHAATLATLRTFVQPWRKLTVAVDGRDHAGKSSLARYLSWQLQMPCIETDFCLRKDGEQPCWDTDLLKRLVEHRHELNRPVIVEGVFVLRNLRTLGIEPDYVVHVRNPNHSGSDIWQAAFTAYESEHYPRGSNTLSIVTPVADGI